ncbi:MAG: hypothetical protein ACRD5R_04675 [Candidatus Acidiferrales bacterium]
MSYIDVTFEKGGDVVNTLVKVYGGWDSSKSRGNQFYDSQLADYRGNVIVRVAVWMSRGWALDNQVPPVPRTDSSMVFPLDFTAQFNDGTLEASIARGRVSISVVLRRELPWIVTKGGKPAVDSGTLAIAQYRNAVFLLRQMIVFNLPSTKAGVLKEWDLLPFLPGGLIERNRRRH